MDIVKSAETALATRRALWRQFKGLDVDALEALASSPEGVHLKLELDAYILARKRRLKAQLESLQLSGEAHERLAVAFAAGLVATASLVRKVPFPVTEEIRTLAELGLYAAAALGWIWLFWVGRAKIQFAKQRLAKLGKVD